VSGANLFLREHLGKVDRCAIVRAEGIDIMTEHLNSTADRKSAAAAVEDEFAVSEHGFTEKLNAEDSSETRERLEDMGEVGQEVRQATGAKANRMLSQLETFTREQPLGALLGALAAGIVLGFIARR
jgi:hypothetical protein